MAEFLFQIDSNIVRRAYTEKDNYLIQQDPDGDPELCALYFSSNDIYYPNNEEQFIKRIVEQDFFEWYASRVPGCGKHIFIRDLFKQWYLGGINDTLNSPQKILEWLQKETAGYKIITVGSSSGGYAATLFGSLLKAKKVFCFNGYFNLTPEVEKELSEEINPILFRNITNPYLMPYYSLEKFLNQQTPVYYFHSLTSPIDRHQKNEIKQNPNVTIIAFRTSLHGIPFLKCCLPIIFCCNKNELHSFSLNEHNPLLFSIKRAGLLTCIAGLLKQLYASYKKRR